MKKKEKMGTILISVIGIWILVFSVMNVSIYLFGKERELYVEHDHHFQLESTRYRIHYYNGKKMVNDRIHLSFIEIWEREHNSGYIPFKQLGTHVTHRSAFVYSSIFLIICITILVIYLKAKLNNKKSKKKNVQVL